MWNRKTNKQKQKKRQHYDGFHGKAEHTIATKYEKELQGNQEQREENEKKKRKVVST